MAITLSELPADSTLLFEIFLDETPLGIGNADEIRGLVEEGIFLPTSTFEPVMRKAFSGGAWNWIHVDDAGELA